MLFPCHRARLALLIVNNLTLKRVVLIVVILFRENINISKI